MTRPTALRLFAFALSALYGLTAAAADLNQRDHIWIVGSSTAFPIVTAAAEYVGRHAGIATPVVESTGTGGGFKPFCGGVGTNWPDLVMASRPMKAAERSECTANHVGDVREVKIGYDGIVIANTKAAPRFALQPGDLYLALAREVPAADAPPRLIPNPYARWQQINPALPDIPILVLGPPPTSGTRDILVERLLHDACLEHPDLQGLRDRDHPTFAEHCYALREDGAFVDAGENDARLVRSSNDPGALGIFGYNFLDRNRDRLQGATIAGVEPSFDTIESGVYPLTRPLYLYVKEQHAGLLKGLDDFVDTLLSDELSGPEGELIEQGLIPLPERRAAAQP